MGTWAMNVALLAAEASFVPIGTRQQVEVSQRRDTAAIILRAEGEMAAAPADVQALLIDYAHHPGLVRHLVESRILARSDRELWVYQRLDLPVISDRDFTLRVRWDEQGSKRSVRTTVDNGHGPPPREHVVRLPRLDGYWELEPIREGTATRVRYTVEIDFGGSVPRSMVRSGAVKDLPAMFQRFRLELDARRAARGAVPGPAQPGPAQPGAAQPGAPR